MSPWQQKLRGAVGCVTDHTTISLARVAGTIAPDLEVALVKATSHDKARAEEAHVQEVILLASASRAYTMACITHLSRRLSRTRNWIVAVKTLNLIHRLLKKAHHSFQDDLFRESRAGDGILYLSGFQDDSGSSGWEYSAFVRTYALYLDELLDYNVCMSGGDNGADSCRLSSSSSSSSSYGRRSGSDTNGSATEEPELGWLTVSFKDMKPSELLESMPPVQKMLDRVLACHPTGAARADCLIQNALECVVRDSFQFYATVCTGLGTLSDAFFKMGYADGSGAFEIFAMAAKQADALIALYGFCKGALKCRSTEYPIVQKIPEELLESMEAYIRDMMTKTGVESQEAETVQPSAGSIIPAAQMCPDILTSKQLAELNEWATDLLSPVKN